MKRIDFETAKLAKNLEEFKSLISTIIFDKTKELPNGWVVAANLVDQYINNFDETKSLEADAKVEWFQSFMDNKTKERKEIAEQVIITKPTEQSIVITEQVTKEEKIEVNQPEKVATPIVKTPVVTPKKPAATTKSFDVKKYEGIGTEGSKSKLSALCGDFLKETSYGTLESRKIELVAMLKENKRYAKSKDVEITNYISKIIITNGDISKLA